MDLRRYPLDEQNCTLEIESCKYCVWFNFMITTKLKAWLNYILYQTLIYCLMETWTSISFQILFYANSFIPLIQVACDVRI